MTGFPANRWRVLGVLCFSLFLAGVDLTVLQNATPSLNRDLRPSSVELLWILDSYSLTVAALLISFGTLSDRVGRKPILLSGFSVFGVASLACAFATSPTALIAARVSLGVGTAMIMAATVSIIRVVFTESGERAFAIGLWTSAHSIGAAVGPILSGVLLEHFWWGSVFLVNVPLIVGVLVAAVLVVPNSKSSVPRRLDLASVALSVAALGCIVYSIKMVGVPGGIGILWAALAVVGVVSMAWFVRRQHRLTVPLVDLSLFRRRSFTLSTVAVLVCFGCYTADLYFIVQWFQVEQSFSPLRAGLALAPMGLANAVGAALAPRLSTRIGLAKAVVVGFLVFAAASVVFGSDLSSNYPTVLFTLLAAGFGAGVIMTLGADAIMSSASADRSGEAAAIQETSFELGAGLGIAVLGTVLNVQLRGADVFEASDTGAYDGALRVVFVVQTALLVVTALGVGYALSTSKSAAASSDA